jgi:hypothetical protein
MERPRHSYASLQGVDQRTFERWEFAELDLGKSGDRSNTSTAPTGHMKASRGSVAGTQTLSQFPKNLGRFDTSQVLTEAAREVPRPDGSIASQPKRAGFTRYHALTLPKAQIQIDLKQNLPQHDNNSLIENDAQEFTHDNKSASKAMLRHKQTISTSDDTSYPQTTTSPKMKMQVNPNPKLQTKMKMNTYANQTLKRPLQQQRKQQFRLRDRDKDKERARKRQMMRMLSKTSQSVDKKHQGHERSRGQEQDWLADLT